MPEPVRPIALDDIMEARERIAGTVLRTPLVKLDLGSGDPEIYLKLENLQPTNAYKIRGATNAVGALSEAERERGVWTISARQRRAGRRLCRARHSASPARSSQSRLRRRPSLSGCGRSELRIVPVSYTEAWQAAESHAFEGMDGTFIHPFDNHHFIAGHGTMGLEIVEDLPEVRTVIAAIGGGGLITGVGSAIKALQPDVKVIGVRTRNRGALRFFACARAGRRNSLTGRPRSSTARAGKASPRACGSGCVRSSTARSSSRSIRRAMQCG